MACDLETREQVIIAPQVGAEAIEFEKNGFSDEACLQQTELKRELHAKGVFENFWGSNNGQAMLPKYGRIRAFIRYHLHVAKNPCHIVADTFRGLQKLRISTWHPLIIAIEECDPLPLGILNSFLTRP
jgi:hypothetical protein